MNDLEVQEHPPQKRRRRKRFDADTARTISERVLAERTPPPACHFGTLLDVADAMLRTGHDPDRVVAAMCAVPTISIGWVEARLNDDKRAAASPRANIDTDRNVPGGRIQL